MFRPRVCLIPTIVALMLSIGLLAAAAQDSETTAQMAWRLLDYIAVDYAEAVSGGEISNQAEYEEMQEFSASARERIAALPPTPEQHVLLRHADELMLAIAQKAEADEVTLKSRMLADSIFRTYPMSIAPTQTPNRELAAMLYAANCASCHGVTGSGDGHLAVELNPPPIDFTDIDRARQRSLFGLYEVISQGVNNTAMAGYTSMSSDDRWALAFLVGSFAFEEDDAEIGARLWLHDNRLHAEFTSIESIARSYPNDLAIEFGESQATAVTAYLRHHPEEAEREDGGPLSVVRAKLAESVLLYEADEQQAAHERAIAAYLDGFEPVEPTLAARDQGLMFQIEDAMAAFRAALADGAPLADVEEQSVAINRLLDRAEQALVRQDAAPASIFLGAFTILLREGLEAILIVIAMIAFLEKAERRDVLPFVHGGWITALAIGGLTWAAATYLVTISGANRELSEGLGSLLAAVVLVSVGIWMHGKAQAGAWQIYIQEKLSAAISRGSAWFLFLLAFIVVYREVFETILFFIALWGQGAHGALISGAVSGAITLAAIGWGLLNYSRHLPIGRFFIYSSLLIAVLAVVLTGKSIAALQEAGWFASHAVEFMPRIDFLAIYPNWEGLLAQIVILVTIAIGFVLNARQAKSVDRGAK